MYQEIIGLKHTAKMLHRVGAALLLSSACLGAPIIKVGCIGDSITAGVCGGNGPCVWAAAAPRLLLARACECRRAVLLLLPPAAALGSVALCRLLLCPPPYHATPHPRRLPYPPPGAARRRVPSHELRKQRQDDAQVRGARGLGLLESDHLARSPGGKRKHLCVVPPPAMHCAPAASPRARGLTARPRPHRAPPHHPIPLSSFPSFPPRYDFIGH